MFNKQNLIDAGVKSTSLYLVDNVIYAGGLPEFDSVTFQQIALQGGVIFVSSNFIHPFLKPYISSALSGFQTVVDPFLESLIITVVGRKLVGVPISIDSSLIMDVIRRSIILYAAQKLVSPIVSKAVGKVL